MGKKALIPQEKWEGLRHAMEEAAGTRKTSKSPGAVPEAEGEAVRPERGTKRGAGEKGKKGRKREKRKGEKEEKKDKRGKKEKGKKSGKKRGKKKDEKKKKRKGKRKKKGKG